VSNNFFYLTFLLFRFIREKTFRSMMYHLLTGPCEKLARSRVTAIKESRSISTYFESLATGSADKESIKEKIDLEIKSALDAGLNFNVSCLFDVFLCYFSSLFFVAHSLLLYIFRYCATFGCMMLVSLKTHWCQVKQGLLLELQSSSIVCWE
jgi:hypothetical protein